ncbi:MAG: hypothetical protein ACKO0M_02030 [Cyanobium sp.]
MGLVRLRVHREGQIQHLCPCPGGITGAAAAPPCGNGGEAGHRCVAVAVAEHPLTMLDDRRLRREMGPVHPALGQPRVDGGAYQQLRRARHRHHALGHVDAETDHIAAAGNVRDEIVLVFIQPDPHREATFRIPLRQVEHMQLLKHHQCDANVLIERLNLIDQADADAIAGGDRQQGLPIDGQSTQRRPHDRGEAFHDRRLRLDAATTREVDDVDVDAADLSGTDLVNSPGVRIRDHGRSSLLRPITFSALMTSVNASSLSIH